MSAAAGLIQVAGAACAPLLVGWIQVLKARLQGRHGPSALQPYRTLVRLWGKSSVDPEGTGPLYRLAPALIAACLLVAVAIVPIAGHAAAGGSAATPSCWWECSRSRALPSRRPHGTPGARLLSWPAPGT